MFNRIENKITKMYNSEYISKYILFLWLYFIAMILIISLSSYSSEETFSEFLIALSSEIFSKSSIVIFIYALMYSMFPLIEIVYSIPWQLVYVILLGVPILLVICDVLKYRFSINNKFMNTLRLLLLIYIIIIYIYTLIASILMAIITFIVNI